MRIFVPLSLGFELMLRYRGTLHHTRGARPFDHLGWTKISWFSWSVVFMLYMYHVLCTDSRLKLMRKSNNRPTNAWFLFSNNSSYHHGKNLKTNHHFKRMIDFSFNLPRGFRGNNFCKMFLTDGGQNMYQTKRLEKEVIQILSAM